MQRFNLRSRRSSSPYLRMRSNAGWRCYLQSPMAQIIIIDHRHCHLRPGGMLPPYHDFRWGTVLCSRKQHSSIAAALDTDHRWGAKWAHTCSPWYYPIAKHCKARHLVIIQVMSRDVHALPDVRPFIREKSDSNMLRATADVERSPMLRANNMLTMVSTTRKLYRSKTSRGMTLQRPGAGFRCAKSRLFVRETSNFIIVS